MASAYAGTVPEIESDALTTFIEALPTHCPHLKELKLSRNNLGVPGAKALGKVMSKLTQNKTDFRLYLDQAKLGDEGVCAFTQSLDGACHLSVLDLQSNGIHAAGVSCLADSICKGKIILTENKSSSSSQYVDITSSLYLSYNSLGLKGVISVAEMIRHIRLMKFGLNLSRCQLTKVGGHLSNTNPVDSLTGIIRDIFGLR